MLIKKEPQNKIYKDLINYVLQNCDVISIEKYHDQHKEEREKERNIILSSGKYSEKEILENYSERFLKEMYLEFKDNKDIFDKDYQERYEMNSIETIKEKLGRKGFEKLIRDNRKRTIEGCINEFVYERLTESWLNKYRKNIIKQKEVVDMDIHITTTYFLKLTPELKEEILNRNSLYTSWIFPNSVENLSFFKDGYCWLYSVSHEELCDICCKNEEEYEYLKSIGIEFWDDKFVPTNKDELYYEEY